MTTINNTNKNNTIILITIIIMLTSTILIIQKNKIHNTQNNDVINILNRSNNITLKYSLPIYYDHNYITNIWPEINEIINHSKKLKNINIQELSNINIPEYKKYLAHIYIYTDLLLSINIIKDNLLIEIKNEKYI